MATNTKPRAVVDGVTYGYYLAEMHGGDELRRLDAYVYLKGTWRGEPVAVEMKQGGYATSSIATQEPGWYDHPPYASEASTYDPDDVRTPYPYPSHFTGALTDTGRKRMGEAALPFVVDWLASPEATAAKGKAIAYAIANAGDRNGGHHIASAAYRAAEIRRAVAKNRAALEAADNDWPLKLGTIAAALEVIGEAYRQAFPRP